MIILLVANLTLTAAMFGVIWMVQIVHYPLLKGLNEKSFLKWHAFHSRQITFIVAPLMTGELILTLWLAGIRMDIVGFSLLALNLLIWAATFFLSVPIHESLSQSNRSARSETDELIDKLVRTNWPRTIFYSAKLLLLIGIFLLTAGK